MYEAFDFTAADVGQRPQLNRLFALHRQNHVQTALDGLAEEERVVSPQFARMFIAEAEASFGLTPADDTARHWLVKRR